MVQTASRAYTALFGFLAHYAFGESSAGHGRGGNTGIRHADHKDGMRIKRRRKVETVQDSL